MTPYLPRAFGDVALIGNDRKLLGIGSLFAMGPGRPALGNVLVPIDLLKPILPDLTD